MIRWPDKDPADAPAVEFDFTNFGGVISSPVVTVQVAGDVDLDPDAILSGSPTVSGAKVVQRIVGGLHGVDYYLQCLAQVDGQPQTIAAMIPVRDRPIVSSFTPRYVTEADFERRFGENELSDLLRPGHSFGQVENEAASIVDGYLAARYTLPLVNVPDLVRGLTADIARYRLWDEKAPEEVFKRYEAALRQLRDLSKGDMMLPPDAAGVPAASGGLAFDGYCAERIMTMDTLKDFG